MEMEMEKKKMSYLSTINQEVMTYTHPILQTNRQDDIT